MPVDRTQSNISALPLLQTLGCTKHSATRCRTLSQFGILAAYLSTKDRVGPRCLRLATMPQKRSTAHTPVQAKGNTTADVVSIQNRSLFALAE